MVETPAIGVRLLAGTGLAAGNWMLVRRVRDGADRRREAGQTLAAVHRMGQAYTNELDAFRSSAV